MGHPGFASFSKEELIALIEALTKQIGMLTKRVEALEAELGKPPKTPDNSSVPPSQGHKANGESETKPKPRPMPALTGPYIQTRRGGATSWPIAASIVGPM